MSDTTGVVPPWHDDAACRGMDPELWFPRRGEPTRPAQDVCATCPVVADCLDWALGNGEQFGIWGGTSERERRRMRRRAVACRRCGRRFVSDGAPRVYCSDACRDAARREGKRASHVRRRTRVAGPWVCPDCGARYDNQAAYGGHRSWELRPDVALRNIGADAQTSDADATAPAQDTP